MIKYWHFGSRDDTLRYYVMAPNKEMAVKVVEDLIGPLNPSRRLVIELPECPEGFAPSGDESQILTEEE
jgi:hypothetical protein